ncbi:hypothetical protein FOZ63_002422, partial [Perkinsus olseni]
MYFDKLPEVIPDKAEWTLPKVNEEELSVCKKLADKYGKEVPMAEDAEEQEELQNEFFSRMARDKLNKYQWTWGQLRKKFNLALEGRVHVCHPDCQCAMAKQSSNVKKYQGVRIVILPLPRQRNIVAVLPFMAPHELRRRSPRLTTLEKGAKRQQHSSGVENRAGWEDLETKDWDCVWEASKLAEDNPITKSPLDFLPSSRSSHHDRPNLDAALEVLDSLETPEDFNRLVESFRAGAGGAVEGRPRSSSTHGEDEPRRGAHKGEAQRNASGIGISSTGKTVERVLDEDGVPCGGTRGCTIVDEYGGVVLNKLMQLQEDMLRRRRKRTTGDSSIPAQFGHTIHCFGLHGFQVERRDLAGMLGEIDKMKDSTYEEEAVAKFKARRQLNLKAQEAQREDAPLLTPRTSRPSDDVKE